ncbi:MAG TPA: elongation factor P [Candidatus Nitrosocosmicus sp.]|nr:elongation factor P [Candidatus Nitrosocosmicus sp.]
MRVKAGNLKKGSFIEHNNELWQVVKAEFYSPGKGSALMKAGLKNIKNGKTLAYTYKSNEDVETLDVEAVEMQYLYKDSAFLYFMNERTYEQAQISIELSSGIEKYLKEGDKLFLLIYNNEPISVRPPQSVRLRVTSTEDAAKGDTVTGARKNAIVETGATVGVPLFIKTGDIIVINPETDEYMERATKQ